jgi:hypothetical protein
MAVLVLPYFDLVGKLDFPDGREGQTHRREAIQSCPSAEIPVEM